jgi:hypothetical protein
MLATLPVVALIERRSLGCDLTTRGSTQVVAWRVLGIGGSSVSSIDQHLLDPSSFYTPLSGNTCAALAFGHSIGRHSRISALSLDFCDETQRVSFRAVGHWGDARAAPVF